MIGGSSYIGGCNAAYPITYLPGVTGTTSIDTMPGGSTRSDYITDVGVGKVGVYAALQSPGGNGAIVLTFSSTAAFPTSSPSFAPFTSLLPTYLPSTKTPISSPSAAPSTVAQTSSTSKSKVIIIIIIIAIVIGSVLFSGTIILYGIHFFSVLRSNHVIMDFNDTRHNDTRSNKECNDISSTCPDEEVELPIIKAGTFYFDLISMNVRC